MFYLGLLGLGAMIVKNMYGVFMHIHGGRYCKVLESLATMNTIFLSFQKGWIRLYTNPILTYLISVANFWCVALKCCQASKSDGWHISPSSIWCSACHLISPTVTRTAYNRCKRGPIGRYINCFRGILLFPTSSLTHLVVEHVRQRLALAVRP